MSSGKTHLVAGKPDIMEKQILAVLSKNRLAVVMEIYHGLEVGEKQKKTN